MANTQETLEAILQSLNNQTVRFEPFRGLHRDIEVLPEKDGSLYFAYDTGAIFLDVKIKENGVETVKRYKMGGSGSGGTGSSGFIYTRADMNAGTLVKIDPDSPPDDDPTYYIYRGGLEEGQLSLPDIDTLIINSNGWFFRVTEVQGSQNRVKVDLISSGSASGGGGGSGGGSSDDLFLEWGTGWGSNRTYVYGQTNELEVTPSSTRDSEVQLRVVIEDTINNRVISDVTNFIPSGSVYKLDTGKLPLSQKGISISISLDSTSSRMYNNYKPKNTFTGITVFRMDLTKADPDEFLPLKGLNNSDPTQTIRYIPTGSSNVSETLHVYVDNEEIMTKAISSGFDGREDSIVIPRQTHGAHNIDLQLSAEIGGVILHSNKLTYQAAWGDDDSATPIVWIGSYDSTIVNYENSYIKYMVYDPLVDLSDEIQVSLYKNGEEVNQISTRYSNTTAEWLSWDITSLYNAPDESTSEKTATTNFSIAVRGVKVDIQVVVTSEGSRDLSLVKRANLMANFTAAGRSNDEVAANRGIFQSSVGNITAQLENFNWQNNGWGRDGVDSDGIDNGAYLTIANGAKVTIPFQNLLLNAPQRPYSFEIRFRVRNIQAYSTLVRTIPYYFYVDENGQKSAVGKTEAEIEANPNWTIYKDADGNTEMDEASSKKETETENGIVLKWLNDDNMGMCLGTQEAYFRTPSGVANVRYAEDKVINISFVVEPTDQLCYIYLNGILSGAVGLPDPSKSSSSFTMNKPFVINSEYCDFDLYRFRIYRDTLTMPNVIHNYLSDMHSIKLYDENDLTRLTDGTELDYETLVKYNKEHPGNQTMPYAVWTLETAADNDALPFFKGDNKLATIDFVNPCLDEALTNGTITEWYYYTHSPSYHVEGIDINVQGTSSQKYPRRNYKTKYKKATSWLSTCGPLKGFPPTQNYYFYKTDNSVPEGLRGKLVTKTETYEETSESGQIVLQTRTIPNTDKTIFDSASMVTLVKNWHMDQEAVATNKFTWKIDYMESSGSYNTGFANLMGNQVYPFYLKHPLEDLGLDATGMRTSVYGFPVLTFQRYQVEGAKNTYNNGYEYKYIGRYNKNLDKSSNEYFGFEVGSYHPYIIRPWTEYKEVKQPMLDGEGNPVLDENGDPKTEKVKQKVADHERPFINQIAECWELRDNQGTWCSFRYPNDNARTQGFRTLVDGTSGDSKQLEVIKHFEYRYTPYDDPMDSAYEYSAFTDENGVKHTDRDSICDYLYDKYSNLEALFNWLDSTDPQSVQTPAPALAQQAGPWVTSINCTDTGEHSEPVFTYQSIGSSALFDPNTTYYSLVNGQYVEQAGLTSLISYIKVAGELKGSNSYFLKDGDNYVAVPIARLTIPGTRNLIQIDANSKFTLYNFVQTEDNEINEEKVYFVFANDVYTAVATPLVEELDTYYEAVLGDTPIDLYTATRPIYYEKVVRYYNTTFSNDTRNYRLAKFRNEFDEHLDKEYCLVYFILTELLLCYDSRGKNMMLASFGPTKWVYNVADDVTAENVTNYYIQDGLVYNRATTYDAETTYYKQESGPYMWYPIFYDIDTQLGLNNSGAYLWDYDADVTMDNLFSTPNSVLWNNFYEVFYDEIVAKYRILRGDANDHTRINGKLKYESIAGAYECDPTIFDSYAMRGIRPVIAIGLDEYYKYLAPTITGYWDTSGGYQRLNSFAYAYTCQGDKKLTTELLLRNRLNYIDSQWLGGNYTSAQVLTEVFIRANANQSGTSDTYLDSASFNNDPTTLSDAAKRRNFKLKEYNDSNGNFVDNGLDARAGYKIKPFLHQSVSYFVDNQPVAPVRYDGGANQQNGVLTNVSPDVLEAYKKTLDVSQQINYIPAADYISSLGDLSLSYPNSIQIFKGKRLLDLNIGSDNPDYYNSLLNAQSDFELADMPLLRSANFSRLTDFGRDVSLAASAKLQEFKALNSTLTTVAFAPGAPLHTVLLPASITGLSLIEHQDLTNILTQPPVLMTKDNETGLYNPVPAENYRGLYIENVTDIGEREATGHALSSIEIRGGKLEYDSYTILKNLIKLKRGARTNTGLSISYYNVHWSPYTLVEKGTPYDNTVTYYELTDHSTYVVYIHVDIDTWESKLINEVIYTYDNTAPKDTIQDLDLLDYLIQQYNEAIRTNSLSQFYGQRAEIATMPIISGSIFVNNVLPKYDKTTDTALNSAKTYYIKDGSDYIAVSTPDVEDIEDYYEDVALIDEAILTSYWKPKYPNLQISAARVLESNITKYVNVLDSGKEEVVDIKRSFNEHPLQTTELAPTKTNYDFKGWAYDPAGNRMFVNYDVTTDRYENFEGALESYSFTTENKVLTLYAIFRIHSYTVNFYNDDGSFLQTVYNPYSTTPGLKEPSVVPTKTNSDGLSPTEIYTWKGWYRKIGNTVAQSLIDLSKFTPTANYEFVAAYESTPTSVYDEQNILNKKYLMYELNSAGDGYRIALNPSYALTGKITLPTQIDGIPVKELGTAAGSFGPSWATSSITHIFWEQENRALQSIKQSCFEALQSLVYYEQPDTCRQINNSAFNGCTRLGVNDPDVFYQILAPVTILSSNVFMNIRASEIHIPGHIYTQFLATQPFGAMTYVRVVQIGKEGDPCQWQEMITNGTLNSATAVFMDLGRMVDTGNNLYIHVYTTGDISNELKASFGVGSTVTIDTIH